MFPAYVDRAIKQGYGMFRMPLRIRNELQPPLHLIRPVGCAVNALFKERLGSGLDDRLHKVSESYEAKRIWKHLPFGHFRALPY
jgi:hypothetical protein